MKKFVTRPRNLFVPNGIKKVLRLLPPRSRHEILPDHSRDSFNRWASYIFILPNISAKEIELVQKGKPLQVTLDKLENYLERTNVMDFEKTTGRLPSPTNPDGSVMYESIADYETKTGKRFRMLKRHKEIGLTREESFNITWLGHVDPTQEV